MYKRNNNPGRIQVEVLLPVVAARRSEQCKHQSEIIYTFYYFNAIVGSKNKTIDDPY